MPAVHIIHCCGFAFCSECLQSIHCTVLHYCVVWCEMQCIAANKQCIAADAKYCSAALCNRWYDTLLWIPLQNFTVGEWWGKSLKCQWKQTNKFKQQSLTLQIADCSVNGSKAAKDPISSSFLCSRSQQWRVSGHAFDQTIFSSIYRFLWIFVQIGANKSKFFQTWIQIFANITKIFCKYQSKFMQIWICMWYECESLSTRCANFK